MVLSSEASTSRSLKPNRSCGIGSEELEFETTRPACSRSHLAVLILEASTSTPRGHMALDSESLSMEQLVVLAPVAP